MKIHTLFLIHFFTLSSFLWGAQLNLVILESGSPVPCRVMVMDASGINYLPNTAKAYRIGAKNFFACPGNAQVDAPSGTIEIRVERGTEYRDVRKFVNLTSGGLTDTTHTFPAG